MSQLIITGLIYVYYSCGHKYRNALICNPHEMVLIWFAYNTRTLSIVTLKFNIFDDKL